MKRILACVVLLSASLVLRLGASNPGQQAASPQKTATSPPPQQAATYVGEATCIGCHDAEGQSIHKSPHGKPENPRSPAAVHGCETCHGPGSAHIEDPSKPGSIKRFGQLSSRDASETCLTCHSRGEHQQWKGSMHEERNLSCITCHSVHNPKSETAQLKTVDVIETCATCHKTEVSKLQRVGHMPVREGKMTCTSCHNPHGSTNTRMLRVGNFVNEACTSCHAEKRGPFLWDHAPVREGCNTCHDPHGSNNDRMLVAKVPMLCQRCHIGTKHPSTIYDANQLAKGSSRLIGRGCVNCHQQIHGSNSPAGNAFLR